MNRTAGVRGAEMTGFVPDFPLERGDFHKYVGVPLSTEVTFKLA